LWPRRQCHKYLKAKKKRAAHARPINKAIKMEFNEFSASGKMHTPNPSKYQRERDSKSQKPKNAAESIYSTHVICQSLLGYF